MTEATWTEALEPRSAGAAALKLAATPRLLVAVVVSGAERFLQEAAACPRH